MAQRMQRGNCVGEKWRIDAIKQQPLNCMYWMDLLGQDLKWSFLSLRVAHLEAQ